MQDIKKIDTIKEYNDYFGIKTLHPHITVIDGRNAKPLHFCRKLLNIYSIIVKGIDCGTMHYGRSIYDYHRGTMLFIAPGQIMGSDDDGYEHQPEGMVLAFHPELLRGTYLASLIREYSYFSYNANEALHLSEQEHRIVEDCMRSVAEELYNPFDRHSHALIIDTIKLLLDRCIRFYDRQFISRHNMNGDLLAKFETLLNEYFHSPTLKEHGLPSVQWCAQQLCLSPNYFSDLMRKETGLSAQKHIHQHSLEVAKEFIADMSLTIAQISDKIGFDYPQHFIRWFRNLEGCTPLEYRNQLLN